MPKCKKEEEDLIVAAIEAVQALPDIEFLLFEAFDFLENGENAAMFMAVNANLRSRWLRKKLPPTIQIFIRKTIDGSMKGLNVSKFITVVELKATLYGKEGYPPTKIHLSYNGKQLKDERSISDYNIKDYSTVDIDLF